MTLFQQDRIEIADYIFTDELLTSCSHASNRYKMYLMGKKQRWSGTWKKIRKRKAIQEELISAKKRKTELQVTAQKLVDSADKKTKEAEKRTDVATLKALLIECNASQKRSQEIMKKGVQKQEEEIKKMEVKLKLLNWKYKKQTSYWICYSYNRPVSI